ncbi:MAG: hypothetical protein OEY59_06485 [Deltaproteobacteria bacterium]|nr:hypothetical protein [Deltaproteobacteria bacterium]
MRTAKLLFLLLMIPFFGCNKGSMVEEPLSDPNCYHTIKEVRYWDLNGDGANDQMVTLSSYYDDQFNQVVRGTEEWDYNADDVTDDFITSTFSDYNQFGDYKRLVVETDIGFDKIIDQTQDSTFDYVYNLNQKVIKRIEYRRIIDITAPETRKNLASITVYDQTGDKIANSVSIDSDLDGYADAVQSYDMTYDGLGTLLAKSYSYDGALRYVSHFDNTYDAKLLLTQVVSETESWDKTGANLGRVYAQVDVSYDVRDYAISETTRQYSDLGMTTLLSTYYRIKTRSQCKISGP